jgi:hypothetical protein
MGSWARVLVCWRAEWSACVSSALLGGASSHCFSPNESSSLVLLQPWLLAALQVVPQPLHQQCLPPQRYKRGPRSVQLQGQTPLPVGLGLLYRHLL